MEVSKFFSSSNMLKFDDVVGVILSEKISRKSLGSSSTSSNVLNAEIMGRSNKRRNNFGGCGKS
jgi:hypothetical protein